jgi:uncharacterized membrane protein YgcG
MDSGIKSINHADIWTFLVLQVVGTISRKDLMGFSIEERLERLLINPPRKLSRSVVLALKKNYGHKKPRGGGATEPTDIEEKNGPENNNLNGGGGSSGAGGS